MAKKDPFEAQRVSAAIPPAEVLAGAVSEAMPSNVEAAPDDPAAAPPPPDEEAARVVVPAGGMPVAVAEVLARVTVSWSGPQFSQMITLNPGDKVSDALYGPGSIKKMEALGVKMQLVE